MYTIDLLKGEGIPIRSRPGGIAMACLIVVLPLLLGLALTSFYMDCRVILAIQTEQLGKLQSSAGALSAALHRKESLEQQKAQALDQLSDIRTTLKEYTQWSPALMALVEDLSDTLVLTRLEARQDTMRRKVPAKDDPARKVEVSVPFRAIRLSVCGEQMTVVSQAVQRLQEDLRASPAIGPMLDTITVSQSATTLDGREAVAYELDCAFKARVE